MSLPASHPTAATCRRLWPSDLPAVRAYFLRLDPDTRASRFMAAVSDRTAAAYAERAMRSPGLMYGAFVAGAVRGLGELRPLDGAGPLGGLGRRAEGALAVERAFRERGLGAMLLRRLAEAGRNRGVAELHLRCLAGNAAMRRLAAGLGAELRRAEGESAGAIALTGPTPLSLWREAVEATLDFGLAAAALPAPLPARAA